MQNRSFRGHAFVALGGGALAKFKVSKKGDEREQSDLGANIKSGRKNEKWFGTNKWLKI